MKYFPQCLLVFCIALMLPILNANAQTTLIDFHFTSATLPTGVTTNGTVSTSGSIGSCSVCSVGRLVLTVSTGYMQVDLPNVSVFKITAKSSGSSARTLTVKYKKGADPGYTTAGTVPNILGVGGEYILTNLFPVLISTSTVSIRIENGAGGDVHIHDLYAVSNPTVSTEADITAFAIPSQIGSAVINATNRTVDITVPSGTSLSSVVPTTVTISADATISPAANVAQNFSGGNEVHYIVTAQDGTTTKDWVVKVTEAASAQKEITAFTLSDAQIGASVINTADGTITVSMPITESLTSLVPETFTLSQFATVDPLVTSAQNFSSPVVYTVTAQDNSTKQWTITVNQVDPNSIYSDYQAEDAQYTGKTDTQHANYTGSGFLDFLAGGENYVQFTVCQQDPGVQTVKFRYSLGKDEVRTGSLYVNDVFVQLLLFPRTVDFTEWVEAAASVTLLSGINSIKLTWDATDGPNLDRLSISGAQCPSYTLNVTTTNNGVVTASPARTTKKYFDVETVTLLADDKPESVFANWTGDLTGTNNPAQVVMSADKNITANFTVVNTYTLTANVNGIGNVTFDPPGGVYAQGTVVSVTPISALGSTFQGWSGDLSGSASPASITMTGNKTVTATFTSNLSIDFEVPVGFASVNTGSTYPDFNGPTTGGQHAQDTLWVNGAADFDMLAWHLFYRNRAYKNLSGTNGVPKSPLVIVLKEGVYTEGTSTSSAWGNSMMTIQEQGDLTIIGQGDVVLKFGFNIKRSWNILIRNITFQDYYDDGINIGEPETHHIWIDHCTVGHPTTMPADSEHPDGGIDVKAGASYITISWCKYRNSWKTGLVGHSDSNGGEDTGKLKVTYFGNYFLNTNSRNPRVRFGEVHVLNNLEEHVALYGIAAANAAHVYAENNFFLNTRWAMYADRTVADFKLVYGNNTDNTFTSKTGNYPASGLKQVGNEYDDSELPVITAQINPAMLNPGGRSVKFDEFQPQNVFDPHTYYSYTAFPASVVRTIVPLFAGAKAINFFSPTVNVPMPATIIVTGTLTPFTQTIGSPSSVQTYSVSATNATNNLTISPPANYQVSADGGSNWFSNGTPLVLNRVGDVVSSTTISVRLNASSAATYSGNISHAIDGVVSTLAVSGTTQANSNQVPEGNWTIYEANQLPNAFSPAFVTSQQSGTFSNTIIVDPDKANNNLLRMETDLIANNNQWRQNVTSGLQTLTVVVKAKNVNANKNLLFDIDMDHGTNRWSMRVLNNGTFNIAVGSVDQSGNTSLGQISTLAYNTFRFTKSGSIVNVYVNESSTPIYTGTANAGTNNFFRFGDGWGSGNIGSVVDWVLWDVTGAYSPTQTSLPASLIDDEDPNEPVAAITIDGTLNSFTQTIGSPSATQTYSVSGTDLTSDIIVTPPTGYEISPNGVDWFGASSPLTLGQSFGVVEAVNISVRLKSASAGPFSGNISHVSAGATTVYVSVTGTAAAPVPDPVLSLTTTLNPFTQTIGSPSAVQTYSVNGTNLTGNITVTPPVNYEVSSDAGTTWKNNANPLVLTATNGSLEKTISVRLNAASAGDYGGNISHTTAGVTTLAKSVSGIATVITAIPEPRGEVGFSAMPNPVKDRLTILRDDINVPAIISIYGMTGAKVSVQRMEIGVASLLVDVSTLNNGLYVIEYVTSQSRKTLKLVK